MGADTKRRNTHTPGPAIMTMGMTMRRQNTPTPVNTVMSVRRHSRAKYGHGGPMPVQLSLLASMGKGG